MTTADEEIDLGPLACQAAEGDAAATEALLARVRPLIVRYCRARLGGRDGGRGSADDVAQEVCLAVLTALPRYVDRGRPFVAFAYGIAAHKVVDAQRLHAVRGDPSGELPDTADLADGPEQIAVAAERTHGLHRLLAMLPDIQREVVILRIAVGMSAREVADSLGMSAGAVRVAQHRALSRLRMLAAAEAELVS
jgi:RNA polymerase sigma-70 factor (ECF subfamily)